MKRIVHDHASGTAHLIAGREHRHISNELATILGNFLRPTDIDSARVYPKVAALAEKMDIFQPQQCNLVEISRGPHLKRVQIELTSGCNLACSYCFSHLEKDVSSPHVTFDVPTLLRECNALGVLAVEFTGGEPLLNPKWRSYVELARSYGIQVYIQTNGTRIDRSVATSLNQNDVAGVQVSLDSHIAQSNDRFRGMPNAYARAIDGIEFLYEEGVPVQISLMMHSENVTEIVESVRFLSTKYRRAVVNVDRVIGFRAGSQIQPVSAERYWHALRPYIGMNVRPSRVCETSGFGYGEPSCGVAYSLVYVTATGEIAACPTMTSRESSELQGPHLGQNTLEFAWYESEFFRKFRFTNCEVAPKCSVGKSCGGGCRSNAYAETAELRAPDVVECNLRKNSSKTWIDFPQLYSKQIYSEPLSS